MSESDRPQHDFSNDPSANSAGSHEVNPTIDKTPEGYVHASELIRQQQERLQMEKQQRGSGDPWWKNILHRKKEHPTTAKSEPIVSHSIVDSQQAVTLHSETPAFSSSELHHGLVNPNQTNTQTEEPVITSVSELHTDAHSVLAEENPSESDHQADEIQNAHSDQEEGATTSVEVSESTTPPPTRPARSRRWTSIIPGSSFLKKAVTSTAIVGSLTAPVSHIANAQEHSNFSNTNAAEHTTSNPFSHEHGVSFSNDIDSTNEQSKLESEVVAPEEITEGPISLNHSEQTTFPVDSFQDTYEKTVEAERIWGEQLTGNMREAYDYALSDKQPGQVYNHIRPVRYYSKGRMDVNPNEKEYHAWFVKSGLLVSEMINGKMQVGDTKFIDLGISKINIVGDPDAGNITYESVAKANSTDQSRLAEGEKVIKMLNQDGSVAEDQKFDKYGVTATNHVTETDHTIATPFWEFMQKDGKNYNDNPYYFTGFPISEPYWTTAEIGGQMRDVMVQAFERRTLTYTPDNIGVADDFVVEYGNAGIHYLKWRYAPKESVIGEQVNTLDYLIPDDQTKSLDGSHNLSTVYDQGENKVYLVKGGGREINGKKVSGMYEQYKITENGVYLEEDHSNGDDKYYSFSDGLMLKKDMKVGETIDNADNVVNFYDNNGQLEKSMPFPFKATLLANTEVYIGGDLGTQKVMVYKYDWRSNYEVFYFSEQYGWVMWELYKADGMLEHNAIFNTIVDSVTHPAPSSRE